MSVEAETALIVLADYALYFSLFVAFILGYRQGRVGV